MKTLYKVTSKARKTRSRGFWIDNHKLYYDYIVPECLPDNANLDKIKKDTKELALFYTEDNKGYVYHNKSKTDILENNLTINSKRKGLKNLLKDVLYTFGGCSVFIEQGYFTIEIYHNSKTKKLRCLET